MNELWFWLVSVDLVSPAGIRKTSSLIEGGLVCGVAYA